MAIEIIDTNDFIEFSSQSVQKSLLYQSAGVTALILNIETGQAIEPCVMPMQVLYNILSGSGSIFVGEEQAQISSGNIVVVGAGETRSIKAEIDMRVLAFQFTNSIQA